MAAATLTLLAGKPVLIYSDSKSCRSLLGDQANNSSFMMNLQDLKKANASDGIFFDFVSIL